MNKIIDGLENIDRKRKIEATKYFLLSKKNKPRQAVSKEIEYGKFVAKK